MRRALASGLVLANVLAGACGSDEGGQEAAARNADTTGTRTDTGEAAGQAPAVLLEPGTGVISAVVEATGWLWWVQDHDASASLRRASITAAGAIEAGAAQSLDQVAQSTTPWSVPSQLVLAGASEPMALWSVNGSPLRWADPRGQAGEVAPGLVTDVDAHGELVVYSQTNDARVVWTRAARLREGEGPLAEATLEFATGVATDGTRTWVIARLWSALMVYEEPGAEPTQAAFWAGDNTMDLYRGPTDLAWWNHATGEALRLPLAPGVGTPSRVVPGSPLYGAGVVVTDHHLYYVTGDLDTFRANDAGGESTELRLIRAPLDGSLAGEVLRTLGASCHPALSLGQGGSVLVAPCTGGVQRVPPPG